MIEKINADQRRHAGQGPFQVDILLPGIAFNPSIDPGFYNLGRIDHAVLKPGAFVGMHQHKNDEILSLLKSGTMLHRDTKGHVVAVSPTQLMMMNAGTGIYHEESIPAEKYDEDVEMLQIFIRPEKENESPEVQFAGFDREPRPGEWRLIAARQGAPLQVRSSIAIWDATLQQSTVSLPPSSFSRTAYLLYLFAGTVEIAGRNLSLTKGDSLVTDEFDISFQALNKAILVGFVVDQEAVFTRNGMFSGLK